MNRETRRWLEQNGLRAEATEQEAWDLFDELKEKGIELKGVNHGERSAATGEPAAARTDGGEAGGEEPLAVPATPAAPDTGARSYDAGEVQRMIDAGITNGIEADRVRRNAVQEMIDVAGVADIDGGNFARGLLDNPHTDRARASEQILQRLATENRPIGAGAQVGVEAPEKLRAAVTDGLMIRSGVRLENPADGASEFRGRSLIGVCRELLSMNGTNTRGLSQMQIASRTMVAGSTSDFGAIFSGLVNRVLQAAYAEWPETWKQWVAITSAMDFRDMHSIKLSGSPDLQGIAENGEFKRAAFSDASESYKVITKGITAALTREMIINDDLRAFTRIPQLFGVAARRMEAAAVYSLLTSNPVMSDGKALFHADRKNLAGTGTAIASDSLSIGRAAMRKRKGLAGESLNIMPAFLLAPVMQETDAEILLRSSALPTADMSAGVVNPWAGKLTPVADPLLDDVSETAWYMLAHPNQAAVIEAAYLEGEEQPYVEEDVKFLSGAIEIGVRHDFGAGVVDHVGAYKNDGA